MKILSWCEILKYHNIANFRSWSLNNILINAFWNIYYEFKLFILRIQLLNKKTYCYVKIKDFYK